MIEQFIDLSAGGPNRDQHCKYTRTAHTKRQLNSTLATRTPRDAFIWRYCRLHDSSVGQRRRRRGRSFQFFRDFAIQVVYKVGEINNRRQLSTTYGVCNLFRWSNRQDLQRISVNLRLVNQTRASTKIVHKHLEFNLTQPRT